MAENFSKTENINLINTGDHAVLFYEEKGNLLSAVHSFVKRSLKNNEKCIYIDSKDNQNKILTELNRKSGKAEDFLKSGQLQFFKLQELYGNPDDFSADDMISLLEKNVKLALKEGYSGLSITGELKGVIDFKGGKEEIIKYEWKLHDQIFEKYPVNALCRYNINRFDNEVIKAAVELHDYIVWQGKLYENPYYIDPEGYKQNKIEEYEIKSWLQNIQQYQKKEDLYKETINKKQKKYFKLYNEAPIGIIKTSSKGQVLQINKKMSEIVGFNSIQEAVNHYSDLGKDFYCNPQKREAFLIQLKKNGEIIWLNMSAKIIETKEDGNFIIEGFVFDISEKKEYEKNLEKKKEELSAYNQQLNAYAVMNLKNCLILV